MATRGEPLGWPLSGGLPVKRQSDIHCPDETGTRWDFYTVGYARKSLAHFVRLLRQRSVGTLVDVRYDAVSRHRPEFSKTNLRAALEQHGISYVHVRDLGVPKEMRASLAETGDYGRFFQWYDENVLVQLGNGIMRQLESQAARPWAFMCVEANPMHCHRHRLALALQSMGLAGTDL